MWHAYKYIENNSASSRKAWSVSHAVLNPLDTSARRSFVYFLPFFLVSSEAAAAPWWNSRTEPRSWTGRRSHRPIRTRRLNLRLSRREKKTPRRRKVRRQTLRLVLGGAAAPPSTPPPSSSPPVRHAMWQLLLLSKGTEARAEPSCPGTAGIARSLSVQTVTHLSPASQWRISGRKKTR